MNQSDIPFLKHFILQYDRDPRIRRGAHPFTLRHLQFDSTSVNSLSLTPPVMEMFLESRNLKKSGKDSRRLELCTTANTHCYIRVCNPKIVERPMTLTAYLESVKIHILPTCNTTCVYTTNIFF
jgi:hypothetical protein